MNKSQLKFLISEIVSELAPMQPQTSNTTDKPQQPPVEQVKSLSTNIQSIFSSFERDLNFSENNIIKRKEAELDKLLKGKTVKIRASIGYKNVEKEYVITVTEAKIIFYYEEYVVSLYGAEKNAKKDKEYILNKGFNVELITTEIPEPTPVSQPVQKTEPVKPQIQKPINPAIKPPISTQQKPVV